MPTDQRKRCDWAKGDLYIAYHDTEWGVPVHDDRTWFEFVILEGAQAGLSWSTILNKRARYRQVFDAFDPVKVARYRPAKKEALLGDAGIVRSRLKIESAVGNARAFLQIQKEFGSFDAYIWPFIGGRPRQNQWRALSEVPAVTSESTALSRDLKRRGFSFTGPTTCYALMQATGMVNDHLLDCPRHAEVAALNP